jgi:hypothetical protein
MTIKFFPNEKGTPAGKLADAELHFSGGPLDGLKLWALRSGNASQAAAGTSRSRPGSTR